MGLFAFNMKPEPLGRGGWGWGRPDPQPGGLGTQLRGNTIFIIFMECPPSSGAGNLVHSRVDSFAR
jgi:hypothetical protein